MHFFNEIKKKKQQKSFPVKIEVAFYLRIWEEF